MRAHKKIKYSLQEGIIAEKVVSMKVRKVEEMLMDPKHKKAERCAIFDPVTE